MKKFAAADFVIFGGGIAGLWLLNRLRQAGYAAILLESGTLGGGQTIKSQGILHGGTKYALQGVLTKEASALKAMPKMWKDSLSGKAAINLSAVPILSEKHYLWASRSLTAKLTGFLASHALSSAVSALQREDYPAVFKHPSFKGEVFALDEMVIDVPILIRELVRSNQDAIFKIEPVCDEGFTFAEDGHLISATVYQSGQTLEIKAQQFIFTAGAGNEIIIKNLKNKELAMQRRPLHMVLVKVPFTYSLYAHCLGFSQRPRITITTHYLQEGHLVWYLGGMLAEEGVLRDAQEQIEAAKKELCELFPWLDFSPAEFATVFVDRAEPLQKNGLKPENFFIKSINNIIVAWPTKLALAPKLAEDILEHIQQNTFTAGMFDLRDLRAWPIPPLSKPIWEDTFCKRDV